MYLDMLHNPANKLHEQQNIASNELKIKKMIALKVTSISLLGSFLHSGLLLFIFFLLKPSFNLKKKNLDHFLERKVNLKINMELFFA